MERSVLNCVPLLTKGNTHLHVDQRLARPLRLREQRIDNKLLHPQCQWLNMSKEEENRHLIVREKTTVFMKKAKEEKEVKHLVAEISTSPEAFTLSCSCEFAHEDHIWISIRSLQEKHKTIVSFA